MWQVRWHGQMSSPRDLPGSGAQGSNLGNWEFLSQTNSYADCVPQQDRYKFVDDLSVLEVINLLNIGLSTFNFKSQVASDIPIHGQYISNTNLKTQQYIENLNKWCTNKMIEISQ